MFHGLLLALQEGIQNLLITRNPWCPRALSWTSGSVPRCLLDKLVGWVGDLSKRMVLKRARAITQFCWAPELLFPTVDPFYSQTGGRRLGQV